MLTARNTKTENIVLKNAPENVPEMMYSHKKTKIILKSEHTIVSLIVVGESKTCILNVIVILSSKVIVNNIFKSSPYEKPPTQKDDGRRCIRQ